MSYDAVGNLEILCEPGPSFDSLAFERALLARPYEVGGREFEQWAAIRQLSHSRTVSPYPTVALGDWAFALPWFEHSELTSRFFDVAYRDGWVSPDFDWPAWEETPEARRLWDDRGAIEQATALDLVRLLTVVIRSERFGEGAVADAIESGLVTAVLRRIEQLRTQDR